MNISDKLELTPEEVELLSVLNVSVESIEAMVTSKEMKKTKIPPKAIYTEKYEVAKNTCSLCTSTWVQTFLMERYTDSSIRSKEQVYTIPEGSKVERLYYTHRSCKMCKTVLQSWDKEELIITLLNDRQLIKRGR